MKSEISHLRSDLANQEKLTGELQVVIDNNELSKAAIFFKATIFNRPDWNLNNKRIFRRPHPRHQTDGRPVCWEPKSSGSHSGEEIFFKYIPVFNKQSYSERAVERDGGACEDLPPHLHGQQHHPLQGDAWTLQGWDHWCLLPSYDDILYVGSDELDIPVIYNL